MLTLHQPIHRQQQFHPQFRFKPINLLGSDIEACLQSMSGKLYHMGFRSRIVRSTLADANQSHD